uniref:Probable outer membrane protein pmp15 n=2 Tax=Chlamydia pneumoniae TaxID=83558 RepID=A0A0F7WYT2_CHLPN|nr:Probable outer membrane protein pmp15 [Chlamydia pneumoniae]
MCTSLVIENNPKGLIFNNNTAALSGGAIHTRSFIFQNNGPTAFINNSATSGGALINLSGIGSTPQNFFLSADYGDILFNNNTITSSSPQPGYRNALYAAPGINLKLGARQGYKILFYDPIDHDQTTTDPIVFNYEPHHLGTVLFSGINVDSNATNPLNFLSKFSNSSRLERGVLAIEDRAAISCKTLSQTGGILRLGNAALIRTKGPGSSINFNAIAINLPSILQSEASAPKFWIYPTLTGSTYSEDTSSTITLSGPLTFLNDENENPYDSLDLSEPRKDIPLLYLLDVTAKKIDTSNLIVEAMNLDEHYGYQGIWSPYWMETTTTTSSTVPEQTNTNHRQLYVDWTPVGYRPNPERHGEFIANTLWQSAYNALLGIRILPPQNLKEHDLEASLQGLGLLINQHNREGRKGFRNHTTGYAATTSAKTAARHSFSLGFAQMFSKTRERQSPSTTSSHNYFAGLRFDSLLFRDFISTGLSLGYSYGDHHMLCHYTEILKGSSKAFFNNHTLVASLDCTFLPARITRTLELQPFISAIALRCSQASFQETGDHIRKFHPKHPLTDLSSPIGFRSEWKTSHHIPMLWTTEISYVPTLYRKNPEMFTTLLISNGTWTTQATPVSYNSVAAKIKNTSQLFSRVTLSLDYSAQVSSSTVGQYLKAESRCTF